MKPCKLVKLFAMLMTPTYVLEGDSWDEVCKIASTETACVLDWLQDVAMVVNSLKTEPMYVSKNDQVRH
jgi:hypothetical protein